MKKLFLIFLFLPLFIQSQDLPVKWSGDIRVRSEADGRDFNTRSPMNFYSLFRVRLGATVDPTENLSLCIQLEDSRTFGEEKDAAGKFNTISNTKNIDLHQAYINVEQFLVDQFAFKLGRFDIAYANERIFGAMNWNNIGRAFDGITFRYSLSAGYLDAFVLNTGETNFLPSPVSAANVRYTQDKGFLVTGGYYSQKFADWFSGDAYAVYQIDANQTRPDTFDLKRTTLGLFGKMKHDPFSGEGEVSYQLGSKQGATINAYMLVLMAGYETGEPLMSSLAVYVDVLSGRAAGDTEYRSYEPLYATGHKFFGAMDFFTSFPLQTYDRGIIDMYLRLTSKPSEKFTIITTMHMFQLMNNLVAGAKNLSALGNELDIVSQWKYSRNLNFEIGAAAFLPDELMRTSYGGSDVATWEYITTQVSF